MRPKDKSDQEPNDNEPPSSQSGPGEVGQSAVSPEITRDQLEAAAAGMGPSVSAAERRKFAAM